MMGPETYLREALDAYAAGRFADFDQVWSSHATEIRRESRKLRLVVASWTIRGSWNLPVLACVVRLLAGWRLKLDADAEEARERLLMYCRHQLGCHGLWGLETFSYLYWWPLPVIALAWRAAQAKGDRQVEDATLMLLEAHVTTLALFSSRSGRIRVPGMRSPKGWTPSGLTYFFRLALGRPDPWAGSDAGVAWPWRVARSAVGEGLPESKRLAIVRTHLDRYDRVSAGALCNWLNDLAGISPWGPRVALRTTVRVAAGSGDVMAAWASRNVGISTPPVMAMTTEAGRERYLYLHPEGFRAESGRRMGEVTCRLEGGHLVARAQRVRLSANAPFRDLQGALPMPVSKWRYIAEIGPAGARLLEVPR